MTSRAMELFHHSNPYDGFPLDDYELNLWGWASDHPVFEIVMKTIKPTRVIEVGSWLGGSAIHMSGIAKSIPIDGFELICVDTWLGADEHWLKPEWFKTLATRNGYPTLFYQFMANVILKGHADVITPLPITSESAFHVLKHHGITADAIYIDAGHRYKDVRADIENYWQLVRPGGVLFGDDFITNFPGVIRAVDEFAESRGQVLQTHGTKWVIQKR